MDFAALRCNVYYHKAHWSKQRLVGRCLCEGNGRAAVGAFHSTPSHAAPPLPSDSLNQFSMCQALQTEPSQAPASKTLAVSEWRSGHCICRLPPGWQGSWQRAPTRWQHVAKLQSCQTVNVSMTTNCSTVVRGADEPTNQCKSVAFRKPQAASLGGEHPTDN